MQKALRISSLLMALLMIFSFMTACSEEKGKDGQESKPAETEAKTEVTTEAGKAEAGKAEEAKGDSKKHKVILITMDQMDQHWVNLDKGAQKAVEELGNVEYKWMAPDVKDDNKQIEMVNNAMASNAEAIVIAANGPDAITSVLQEVVDAGIKIIYVDSPANFEGVATLATNNKAAGKTAGEKMKEELEAKGIKEGKIGVISVNSATQSTVDREDGLREAFEGTGFEVLETQYTDGDVARSKDAAANFITEGCVGIFATNEGTTVGTGNAIKEASEKVVGAGFDKSDKILELIEEGHLFAVMAQNPDVMGYEGIKTAVAALEGKEPAEKVIDTGVSVITKENVSDFK